LEALPFTSVLESCRSPALAADSIKDWIHAFKLTRGTFIPGWLGNLCLGLAELALDRNCFEDANILLEQVEAHYKNTRQGTGGVKYKLD
jgi:hypothetical protein